MWRGQDLLPTILGEPKHTTSERLDAFAELAVLSILIGLVVGIVCRVGSSVIRNSLVRRLQAAETPESPPARRRLKNIPSWTRARLKREVRARTLPNSAWDRLLTRLVNRKQAVVCRVATRSGGEVFGVLAHRGYVDWEADGRGLLFDLEVTIDDAGQLIRSRPAKVYVPGDEIAVYPKSVGSRR